MAEISSRFDLLIIGGGVNGCGIARDAAGRGLSVALFEQSDLASGASSASTKLVHGGLRYLETFDFRLVREALAERERLLRMAPHIIWPLRFVLPHHAGLRPAWMLRLGLFIYDHLAARRLLPATRSLDLRTDVAGVPLADRAARAFEYSDCWVDDARLVVLNAMDAAARGAHIETRARVTHAARDADSWRVTIETGGRTRVVAARALVNATGPWAAQVLAEVVTDAAPAPLRLVQGSHIIVPKQFAHDRAYLFQNRDRRIIFAIPYETDFTLIGTTDRDWSDAPTSPHASETEISYLCDCANEYFTQKISPDDVVHSYSGLRPLLHDAARKAQSASREYRLQIDVGAPANAAPLLNVFGGKITTYRSLAEHALTKLAPWLVDAKLSAKSPAIAPAWTASAALPGGDFPVDGADRLLARLRLERPWLGLCDAQRMVRAYGTLAFAILPTTLAACGEDFGCGLSEAEVRHLVTREWARTTDDILWRRGKLGLRFNAAQTARLGAFLETLVSTIGRK